MINKKQLFEQLGTTPASYLFFFFLILHWSCIIQIAMCFSEVEDLIFSCDCLPSGRHCEKHFTCKITINPLNILKRSVLILSSIFYR